MKLEHPSYLTNVGPNQWIVNNWDSSIGMYRESFNMPYTTARFYNGQNNCPGANGGTCRNKEHKHIEDV